MKKGLLITISVIFLLILIIVIFVYKASGSNNSQVINSCDPFNVNIVKGSEDNTVLVSWNTKKECSSYILYGEDMKDLSLVAVDTSHSVKSKNHTMLITSLLSSKTYYFSIVSENTTYGKNGLPISFSIDSL